MFKTLKQKLLALVLFSIGGTLLVAGLALSVLTEQSHAERNHQQLQLFFSRSAAELQELLRSSTRSRDELLTRAEIRQSLYLISTYADANNYQALVFDEEKKKLSRLLLNHARSSGDTQISIYDDQGILVAFAKRLPEGSLRGIVTYSNGNPQMLVTANGGEHNDEWQPPTLAERRELPAVYGLPGENGTWFTSRRATIAAYSLGHLNHRFSDGRKLDVGSLHVERHVDPQFLKAIASRFNGRFSLIAPTGDTLGDELGLGEELSGQPLPDLFTRKARVGPWQHPDAPFLQAYQIELSNGERFYLAGKVDSTPAESQATLIQQVAIGVFLIAALVLLPFVLWFARRAIIDPIQRLETSVQALGSGDYDIETPDCGSTEVDNLARSLLETARVVRGRELDLRKHSSTLEQQISERTADLTKANLSLINSQRMLQLVMDNIPQGVFWKDRSGHYLGGNATFLKVAGISSPEALVGLTDYDLPWSTEEAESYRQDDRQVMEQNQPRYGIRETNRTAAGDETFLETNKIPLHDNEGRVIGVLGTFADITDKVNAEQKLHEAVTTAQEASRAKSEFLARMSHELRTPLNSILGFAQMLQLSTQDNLTDQQKSHVGEIESAGQHLLQLISEVLDLSEAESGEMAPEPETVDLGAVLAEALSLAADIAAYHQVELAPQTGTGPPLYVRADPLRLRQVLVNLLNNAIKYNRPGGLVRVELAPTSDGTLRVSVIDTGPGIPTDEQHKLFRPFERLDAAQRGIDGVGIGLVIVKELVERMGGEVGLDSEPDQGSTFWFSLPMVEKVAEQAPPPATGVEEPPVAYVPAHTRTVLYVEDNRANFRLVQELLSEHSDYELVWAESGEQGLVSAEQLRPAVVLMDMHMPGLSGTETFVKLQENPLTCGIPVVALSANAIEEDIEAALELGFRAYLTKPVRIQELLKQLKHFIGPA